ncbi:ABC transporter permease [Aestuariivirga litoralis]|uniref:ABC transporter permease n=1 Tax=Aestuariivirga litoralis TaxID=2650924 RepID=UPI0018C51249|nr:ABC transporter permease [Aestuariivirga litoralis]MBG1232704.1 ABC transporter permease [Aestuariivirga litoralis]
MTSTSAPAPLRDIKARRTFTQNVIRTLKTAPLSAWFGMIVILIYALVAIFAPLLAPYGEAQVIGKAYLPSSELSILGTDQIGRDIFSRLIYGARNTIGIALITTLFSFFVGGTLGILAALLRGWFDQGVSRVVDAFLAIPVLIFALMMLAVLGKSVVNLVIILALLDSTRVFRLARAVALNSAVMDYVESARLRGERTPWIVFREILPNILPPLITEFGLRFCFVFLTIAALSFLGVGVQPPTADWGSMVAENKTLINYPAQAFPYIRVPFYPASAIALLTVAVNFVVDWFLHKTSGLK